MTNLPPLVMRPGVDFRQLRLDRSIIYRLLPPDGDSFLAVLSGLWVDDAAGQPFAGLRALEGSTCAPLWAILSPGAGHQLSLNAYAAAFPEARAYVMDGRIPRANPELAVPMARGGWAEVPRKDGALLAS